MRDWNSCPLENRISFVNGFDLTYEGLKLELLAWRLFYWDLFWSYLWGIETTKYNQRSDSQSRFDLTYEGLKPLDRLELERTIGVLILPMRDWNIFQPSTLQTKNWVLILPMRDWNWTTSIFTMYRFFRFDLTYEGLKFYIDAYLFSTSCVLILPMRDWNFSKMSNGNSRFEFWSYLWGIEIRISPPLLAAPLLFWSYLWGIET